MGKMDKSENNSYIYRWASSIVNHPYFTKFIMTVIFVNAIVIGMETYNSIYQPHMSLFHSVERIFLWIFTIEIALRIIATKSPRYNFFKNGWNNFDFIIVASSLIFAGAYFVSVLRIIRVLRILRAISIIPSLQRLVNALLSTIPALGNILLLMSIIFYIFAVMGTILFSEVSPEYFGALHLSLLTLFQIVTLDSWASGVMRPLNEIVPWAWVYFLSFVLVGTFVVINLFVGVIVNNVQQANITAEDKEKAKENERKKEMLGEDIKMLRQEIAELKQLIGTKERHSKEEV